MCDIIYFPPRVICQKCGRSKLSDVPLPENGRILSYTTIHIAPNGFSAPYTIAIVDVGGVMITAQIDGDKNRIKTGADVRAVFRKISESDDGLINYGLKFEIIED